MSRLDCDMIIMKSYDSRDIMFSRIISKSLVSVPRSFTRPLHVSVMAPVAVGDKVTCRIS